MERERLVHPLPTDPASKPLKVYDNPNPDIRPAIDEPRYGFQGSSQDETTCAMHINGVGYVVIRAHAESAGICIFTEGEVANGEVNPS